MSCRSSGGRAFHTLGPAADSTKVSSSILGFDMTADLMNEMLKRLYQKRFVKRSLGNAD